MTEEIWSDIPGFPDYAVSNHGRVISIMTGKELRPRPNSYGHLRVSLRQSGRTIDRMIHQLVAEAFLSGYEDGVKIRHLDEDNGNNYVENLRFLGGKRLGQLRKTGDHIVVRRVRVVELDKEFVSVREVAKAINGDPSTIYRVLSGGRGSHKGYTFEMVERVYGG